MPLTFTGAIYPGGSAYFTVPLAFHAAIYPGGSAWFQGGQRGINRIVTGKPHVALDAPPRGTHGLMPPEWGVVQDFDLDDGAAEFSIRYADGRLLTRGQSSAGTLTIQMTLRMASSAVLPERGSTFSHVWRGTARTFVVWAVSPTYRVRGLRMVDVMAIHELDLGNRTPFETPKHEFTLTLS